jgi:hypothetical protein
VLKSYGWTADLLEAALNGRRVPCVSLKVSVELEALRINSLYSLERQGLLQKGRVTHDGGAKEQQ